MRSGTRTPLATLAAVTGSLNRVANSLARIADSLTEGVGHLAAIRQSLDRSAAAKYTYPAPQTITFPGWVPLVQVERWVTNAPSGPDAPDDGMAAVHMVLATPNA